MATIKTLAPMVNAKLPVKVPSFTVNDAILIAVRKFCDDTGILTSDATLRVKAGVAEYTLSPNDNNVVIASIESVMDGFDLLSPLSKGYTARAKGKPRAYFSKRPGIITLMPTPHEDGELSLVLTVKPTVNATDVDDFIFELYGEILRDGALCELHSQLGVAWGDANTAEAYRQKFEAGINDVRVAISIGYNNESATLDTSGFM